MSEFELQGVTFQGAPVPDGQAGTLDRLPTELRALLEQLNGFVAYAGGLHVRGVCEEPAWHSLLLAWEGPQAMHRLFPAVAATDVPFAQDCLGDQFLLREGTVHRLAAETGELESMEVGLWGFFHAAQSHPEDFLRMAPLIAFWEEGQRLAPGELLSAMPPYVLKAEDSRRSLRATPGLERVAFLADLAARLRDLPEGTRVRLAPGRPPRQ